MNGAASTLVAGNLIGTNSTGTSALANGWNVSYGGGIEVHSGSDSSTIGGLTNADRNVVSGNTGFGIEIHFSSSVSVRGNYIGTDANGTAAIGNSGSGVLLQNFATSSTIGGTAAGAANIISANQNGITVTGPGTTSNAIQGNHIGTNTTGTVALGNILNGIEVGGSAHDNPIGGSAGGRNVISGNDNGIYLHADAGSGNTVSFNYIGTNASGTAAVANVHDGVISQASASPSVQSNVISGNLRFGIYALSPGANLSISTNLIGTKADGTSALGNLAEGVYLNNTPSNTVSGNTIAFNASNGVGTSSDATGTGNRISQNSIHDNSALGIDLITNGVTANDAGDGDIGPNDLQNFPVLTSAVVSGGSTTVQGTLNSTASTAFTIEFFSNPTCDSSGNGEGQVYLGSTSPVTTDGSGNVSFTKSGLPAVTVGQVVTATATRNSAPLDTSEFSACRTVTSGCTDTDGDTICDTSDNCPAVSNVSQANSDGDTFGDACDNCPNTTNQNQLNTDGDEYGDACEQPQCVTVINHWIVPPGDDDCDGFPSTVAASGKAPESFLGTDPAAKCAASSTANNEPLPDAWPFDFNDDQKANILDVSTFSSHFNKNSPDPNYAVRWDFNADSRVNILDISQFSALFNKSCFP
jgi:hypothetical protein